MAQTFQAAPFQWGEVNQMWFASAIPSAATDGPFKVGDWIVNTAPTAGGTAVWICTTAGTGATGTFKAVSIAA